MILEIISISIAVVLVGVLFVHKQIELSRGTKQAVAIVREKADVHVESAVKYAETAVSSITVRNSVLVANGAVVWTARVLLHVFSAASRVFHHLVERGSRRQENLKQGGAASFYLKQIREVKNDTTLTDGEKKE